MELRTFLAGVCRRMTRGDAPTSEDVAKLRVYMEDFQLVAVPDPQWDGFVPQIELPEGLGRVTALVVGSAFRTMIEGKLLRLYRCAGKDCQQLVLSTTGRVRMWCDLALCADREKARRRR